MGKIYLEKRTLGGNQRGPTYLNLFNMRKRKRVIYSRLAQTIKGDSTNSGYRESKYSFV